MDALTDHQGGQGHPDHHGHADCHHHHHHHNHTDECCNHHEPHSIASLPDRLACEEMANAMTAMVLNDEKGITSGPFMVNFRSTSTNDLDFRADKDK